MEIEILKKSDLDLYFSHYEKMLNQSGVDGLPIFNFFIPGSYVLTEETKNAIASRNQIELSDLNWERNFVYKENGIIQGHLLFRASGIKEAFHRVTLMMGINKNFIGKGVGSRLMEEGLNWCKKQSFIEWIDLGVFEDNIPAQKLYTKYSFEEVSRKKDAYRIADKQINLINMSLRL
jgi:ribosomal protein S18 acetylase RimI-like enzyme